MGKMKALVYENYGTPQVLQLREIEKPVPKDKEVLIKVRAASLNDWDLGLLTGDFVNRMINGRKKPKIKILGSDIAGTIEAIGAAVTKFSVGDDVYGDLSNHWGGFAEYVCADENLLALKPPSMSFVDAASIPQAAMLAVQGLIDKGNIQHGQKVLVNGAAGGVGTFAIQIAKRFNVEMTGVDSGEKLQMMRQLGYDHVIDYQKQDFTRMENLYDLILDAKTNRSMVNYLRVLKPKGIYVTIGGDMSRMLQCLIFSAVLSIMGRKKIKIVVLKTNKDLPYMNKLFESGKLKPVIDGPYRLEDAVKVFEYFQAGHHKGKVVFTISESSQ